MATLFHTWQYGKLIEIQSNLRRKKLHRTNLGSNFLDRSFSNRDNARVTIQFRRESQPQHLKRGFYLKNRPIHFHINNTNLQFLHIPACKNCIFLQKKNSLTVQKIFKLIQKLMKIHNFFTLAYPKYLFFTISVAIFHNFNFIFLFEVLSSCYENMCNSFIFIKLPFSNEGLFNPYLCTLKNKS